MGRVLILIMLIFSGCKSSDSSVKPVKVEFREIGNSMRVNYKVMVTKDGKRSYAVSGKSLGIGNKIEKAFIGTSPNSVVINFNAEGAKELSEVTAKLVGGRMGIIIDGYLVVAPEIKEQITGGMVQISGAFTVEEAQEIVAGINKSLQK
ncbi:MAG: hypothetical protein NE327_11095 [Lentisphaeraceae bacterium]|nr:hypothetical protein [Lentisphaeraceae bacterium]